MKTKTSHILLVDDEESFLAVMARAFERQGYQVTRANNIEQALSAVEHTKFNKAVVDLKLASESGLTLIPQLKTKQPDLEIVMLTGYSSIATAVEAVKLGALNYLCKPASVQNILNCFGGETVTTEIPEQPHSVDRLEWEHIQKVLQENNNNVSATARALGMHRRTLQRKLLKKPVKR
ncbi:MAG: two-component system response regulator RegA [Pseudohongiellaceae bacterium]|jgi:two-component system response regulator RegA